MADFCSSDERMTPAHHVIWFATDRPVSGTASLKSDPEPEQLLTADDGDEH